MSARKTVLNQVESFVAPGPQSLPDLTPRPPASMKSVKPGEYVRLAHGAGGRLTTELVRDYIAPVLSEKTDMDDAAVLSVSGVALAFTTDSFVVDPLFFPGGDIGRLAVFGTVNDLSVQGARPLWLSLAVIAAEGLPMSTLLSVVRSVGAAAGEAGVRVVTGDTKVVGRESLDGLMLNTAGIGLMLPGALLSASRVEKGDIVIVSGPIGDHEAAIVCHRHELGFSRVKSDCAPVNDFAAALVDKVGSGLKWMRDPTRGGLATALNELAADRRATIVIDESCLPVDRDVRSVCEMLGTDMAYMACEGRAVAVVEEALADRALEVMRGFESGAGSQVIGRVTGVGVAHPQVELYTSLKSRRILRYLAADQQPRIC